MSTKTFDSTLDLVGTASKSSEPGFLARVRLAFEAVSEGLRLASEYKSLTDRGMAPDVAARKVFEQIKA